MGIAQQPAGGRLTASTFNSEPVVVSYLTTGTVANSNAETIIGTFTIPAGDPTSPGGYFWKVFGVVAATASPTLIIRMRMTNLAGTALLNPSAVTASAATSQFAIEGFLGFEAIGTSGTYGAANTLDQGFTGSAALTGGLVDAVAINTTLSNTLVITAQFSVANAGNTATTKFGALYRL